MRTLLKKLYTGVINYDPEARQLQKFVESLVQSKDVRMADIGCGYGRNLKRLQEKGFNVIGVEVNQEIVAHNKKNNLPCIDSETFARTQDQYDVLIMSHIIEHFAPQDLKNFMDDYLDRLKVGGHLIIVTPLMSPYFYDDFDHIKPYHPEGILMVFGHDQAQVQYYARNKLKLKQIWFRRHYYRMHFYQGRYSRNCVTRFIQIVDFISALLLMLSGGRLGRKDAWMGVFEKVV